ncbi:MAG: hypothetical protein RIC24_12005 [Hyphomicrobiales bacterium]
MPAHLHESLQQRQGPETQWMMDQPTILPVLSTGVVLPKDQGRAATFGLYRQPLAPQPQARFLIPTVDLLDIYRGTNIGWKAQAHCSRISMGKHHRCTLLRTTRQVVAVAKRICCRAARHKSHQKARKRHAERQFFYHDHHETSLARADRFVGSRLQRGKRSNSSKIDEDFLLLEWPAYVLIRKELGRMEVQAGL